jgi:hypothetical protein
MGGDIDERCNFRTTKSQVFHFWVKNVSVEPEAIILQKYPELGFKIDCAYQHLIGIQIFSEVAGR